MTDKLDGLSMDIEQAQRDKLQAVFPESFTEGRLDIDKLLSLCGESRRYTASLGFSRSRPESGIWP